MRTKQQLGLIALVAWQSTPLDAGAEEVCRQVDTLVQVSSGDSCGHSEGPQLLGEAMTGKPATYDGAGQSQKTDARPRPTEGPSLRGRLKRVAKFLLILLSLPLFLPILLILLPLAILCFLVFSCLGLAAFGASRGCDWKELCPGPALEGQELEDLRAFMEERCRPHADQYNFRIVLKAAYLLNNEATERRFQDFQKNLSVTKKASNTKRLFHGTSSKGASGILSGGFRLPLRGGNMFGKGVYFADCPLKSLQYCKGTGPMLLCDVELGSCKTVRMARPNLKPEWDLQRPWYKRLVGYKPYDSVMATGCVRVPEWTVYRPEQAVPRFALVVKKARKV